MPCCPHLRPGSPATPWRGCEHLFSEGEEVFNRAWRGEGAAHDMLCKACFEQEECASPLYTLCRKCQEHVVARLWWDESRGKTSQRSAATLTNPLTLASTWALELSPLAVPQGLIASPDGQSCYVLGRGEGEQTFELWSVSASSQQRVMAALPYMDEDEPPGLAACSRSARYVAICTPRGQHGVLVDAVEQRVVMPLDRGDYYPEQTQFPVAFFEHEGREVVVHGTQWNRLDVSVARTGQLLTAREPELGDDGRAISAHNLDFFHGQLRASPGGQWVVDMGWVWHPWGVMLAWRLDRWLAESVWEAESGESKHDLCGISGEDWHYPYCFVDEHTVAVAAILGDDGLPIPGITLLDVRTGRETGFIGMDQGALKLSAWGERIYVEVAGEGVSAFDVESGERVGHAPGARLDAWGGGAVFMWDKAGEALQRFELE